MRQNGKLALHVYIETEDGNKHGIAYDMTPEKNHITTKRFDKIYLSLRPSAAKVLRDIGVIREIS